MTSHCCPLGPPGAAGAADETAGATAAAAALAAGAPEADGEAAAATAIAAGCALNPTVAVPAAGTCTELAALVGRPKLKGGRTAEAVAAAG